MEAFDHINRTHGKGTLKMASEALTRAWEPRKKMSSPRYTSNWADLPTAHLYKS
jgi:DNA polymerase V